MSAISDADLRITILTLKSFVKLELDGFKLDTKYNQLKKYIRASSRSIDFSNEMKQSLDKKLVNSCKMISQRKERSFLCSYKLLDGPVEYECKSESDFDEIDNILYKSKKCYICKSIYTVIDNLYHYLCQSCAKINKAKRIASRDLTGKTAILTGGRKKIGYQTGLKLLRMNANVLITTRFPGDAVERYSKEKDYLVWKDRLKIIGIDFAISSHVEKLCNFILTNYTKIDILINNAAQTLDRPPEFYKHLADKEAHKLKNASAPFIKTYKPESNETQLTTHNSYFPENLLDIHGQQIDTRKHNSWTKRIEDVEPREVAKVLFINTLVPFIIISKLKPLMTENSFIINVSAMEGNFSRYKKGCKHPHTNMAKAALNMITRTSAQDFAKCGIYMNSVDTGWINNENPLHLKIKSPFVPPLDEIDAASRILDTVVTDSNINGVFLKDYDIYPW
jgi:NAD(P)-dependent dehydrogenase (short-subunit alcohol dehydrogenase family)